MMRKAAIVVVLLAAGTAEAAPKIITYQGKLEGVSALGSVDVGFAIYDAQTGGTELWSEEQTVDLWSGVFTAKLGLGEPLDLDFATDTWLEVTVMDGSDELIFPRQQMTSVAAAFRAFDAEALGGEPPSFYAPAGALIDGSAATTPVGWNDIAGKPAGLNDGDDDTIVTAAPGGGLLLDGDELSLDGEACDAGEFWQWEGSYWQCGPEAGVYQGTSPITIDEDSHLVGLSSVGCANGSGWQWRGAGVGWECVATGDITGVVAGPGLSGGGDTGNVSLALAAPTATTLGGIRQGSCGAGNRVTGIDGSGNLDCQPAVTSIATAVGSGLNNTSAAGVVSLALNTPTTTALGGIVVRSCPAATPFLSAIDSSGTPQCSAIPTPAPTTLGGVRSLACPAGQSVTGLTTLGDLSCGASGATYTASTGVQIAGGDIQLTAAYASGAAYDLRFVNATTDTMDSLGERLVLNADPLHPSIEMRDTDGDGLQPYIDFSNDGASDYDVRVQLTGNDAFNVTGGSLQNEGATVVTTLTSSGSVTIGGSGNSRTVDVAFAGSTCAAGTVVRGITAAGALDCVVPSSTPYTASAGVTLVGNDFRLDAPVSIAYGGTGATSASTARTSLGAAASGANADITSLSSLASARFLELPANGVQSITIRAADSVPSDVTLTLPADDGALNQVLRTDGSGNLSWTSASSGTVTAVTATGPLASSGGTAPDISLTGIVPIANGGTGAFNAAAARGNLGAAVSGANADITALSALTTPLSIAQGGTGSIVQNFVDLTTNQTIAGNKVFSPTADLAGIVVRQTSAVGPTANVFAVQNNAGSATFLSVNSAGTVGWSGTATGNAATATTATNLVGAGSTTGAVDLDTAEAAGLLPLGKGGTGSNLAATGPGFVRQAAAGVALSVGALGAGDLPSGGYDGRYLRRDAVDTASVAVPATGGSLYAFTQSDTAAASATRSVLTLSDATTVPGGSDYLIRAVNGATTRFTVTTGGDVAAMSFSGGGAALTSLNASNLAAGTVPSARLSGSYTGITGVGTLATGTWNATTIGVGYGGTGLTASGAVGNFLHSDGANWASGAIVASDLPAHAHAASDITAGLLPIARGGTNSGTALTGSAVMVSSGSAVVQGPAGTASTVLHGNAAGAPSYGAVALGSEVSGTLPVASGGTGLAGSGASGNYLRSDGAVWASAAIAAADLPAGGYDARYLRKDAADSASVSVASAGGSLYSFAQSDTATASGTRSVLTLSDATTVPGGSDYLIRALNGATTRFTVSTAGDVAATSFTGGGAALTSLNASNLASGTVPSARVSGAYGGLTGVGTLTSGTWNATAVGAAYGGTGQPGGYATGDLLYASGAAALS
ncbi:MAG: hypothetical protein AABZ30_16550, partial [Myxococcota bacterium]